jgi:DNA polymerase-3 subunit gamma/tau
VLDEPSATKKSEPVKRPVTTSPSSQPVSPRPLTPPLHSVSEAEVAVKSSPQATPVQEDEVPPDLTLTAENWTSTVEQIKLSALAHQLAENAAFVRTDGQQVYLTISPELNHLATDNTKQKLQTALSKQFGTDIQLKFIDQNEVSQSVSTLAQEKATFQAERQQQAVDSIASDPTIEIIKNTFNARIIEQSIKPADE